MLIRGKELNQPQFEFFLQFDWKNSFSKIQVYFGSRDCRERESFLFAYNKQSYSPSVLKFLHHSHLISLLDIA